MKATLPLSTALLIGVTLVSCDDNRTPASNEKTATYLDKKEPITVDTSTSFKFEGQWIAPIDSLEISGITSHGNDTIDIVSCYKYFSDPFGRVENLKSLKTSLLKNFRITNKQVQVYKEPSEYRTFQELTLKSNKLLIYFDEDSEAMPHSFIVKGVINSPDVILENDIKVGMSIGSFYKTFFKSIPVSLLRKYKVIAFKRCVDGDTNHFYTFADGKLSKIEFSTN